MDADPRLDELVAPLRSDVVSGASELARTAADVLRRAAVRIRAGSIEELRWNLGEVSTRVLDAQPAMAPLVALVRQVMEAVEAAHSLSDGRHAAASSAEAFRAALESRARTVAELAREVLPVGGTVATISSSSTVRRLLQAEAGPRGIRVLCFESRPLNEGRGLATVLAEAGVDVTYAVDAGVHALVPGCEAVLMGADSIGDLGVVNKIGSASVARAAAGAGVPVFVLADDTKVLPRGFPQPLEDDRPPSEVWTAPEGIRVWNRYFEAVPTHLVSALVTESGVEAPDAFEARRARLAYPAGLRAWAAGHHRESS